MNLDDDEAQPFAESPNGDGAVDQSIRADALGLRRRCEFFNEDGEQKRYMQRRKTGPSPALPLQKILRSNCIRHSNHLHFP